MSRRLRVVVPGFLIGSGLSVFLGLLAIGKSEPATSTMEFLCDFLVCLGPLGGPLSEPLALVDFDWVRMIVATAVLAGLAGLHPWRPGIATGVISGLAIAVWFFWGLAMTYNGV
jgi:hypothetical protein